MAGRNAHLITRCIDAVDRLTDAIGRAASWLTALMALVTVTVVTLRYAFDQGAIFLQESVMYMHGIVFMLGIPYALKENAHVRVDIFYARLSIRARTWVDVIGHLVCLVPVSLSILYFSANYVANSWRVLERSPEVGGIPAVFLLKSLLPVMAITLLIQGLAEAARGILRGLNALPERPSP